MLEIALSIFLLSLAISGLVIALAFRRYARELKNERDLFFTQQRNQAQRMQRSDAGKHRFSLDNQAKDTQQ